MSQQTAIARPPFAVDDQDTKYNNYLDQDRDSKRLGPESNGTNPSSRRPTPSIATDRDSGLGNGLFAALAAANDDSDDSDDEPHPAPSPRSPNSRSVAPVDTNVKSKNQALFEAAVGESMITPPTTSISPPPPAYEELGQRRSNEKGRVPSPQPPGGPSPNLHPQHQEQQHRGPSPAPSITPPPPAAPLQVHIPAHQMNAPQPKRVITAGGPQPGGPGMPRGPPLSINPPPPSQFNNGLGFGSPMPGSAAFGTPGFHMNPTPIPANTSTPIQPAFIKPIKPVFIKPDSEGNEEKSPSVLSHESSMPIMRGEKEDYLPLRSGQRIPRVGQKRMEGDDFWRRFSMVVKQETVQPAGTKSEWLQKNMRGGRSYTRLVWCIGIFALIIIAGGSAAGWYFSRDSPSHSIPVAIGGGASETMSQAQATVPTPVAAPATSTTKKPAKPTAEANTKRSESAAVKMKKGMRPAAQHHRKRQLEGEVSNNTSPS